MYNFDVAPSRVGSGSMKWDSIESGVLPLWVADMDFETAPAVKEALQRRVEHGVFGYTQVDEGYYDAIVGWFSRRHGWTIDRNHILYTSGVVPAISCTIQALTQPGDNVLVTTPVYNCFFSCIRNQGCQVSESALRVVDGKYEVDWEDFEARCAQEKTTVFLLCNPHNPGGRVWTRDELARMGDICARHGVTIISDEIHCELVMPGYKFVPTATASDTCARITVALNSPSKNFNTAGLQIANIICPDAECRRRIDRVINIYEVCDVNPFGPIALKAAYNDSEQWLNELVAYLAGNYAALREYLGKAMPQLRVMELEGTYLAWVDISALGLSSEDATQRILERGRVLVSSGTAYGADGEGYIRINMACPRKVLLDGLQRIVAALA